jgi:predicted transcriptional regulator
MSGRATCPHCGGSLTVLAAARVIAAPETRDALILERVVQVVDEHGPLSARKVAEKAHRRHSDVRRALHEAQAAGRIRETESGWTS